MSFLALRPRLATKSPRSLWRSRILEMCLALAVSAAATHATTLSKQVEIDFFRDSTSRNLKGLATRSDGRVVAGPVFTELKGTPLADLLWTIAPAGKGKWWVGTGPDGKILEVTLDASGPLYSAKEVVKLDDSHVFAIAALEGERLLAGTSPNGALHLLQDGKLVARLSLPVDSIFDLRVLDKNTVLVSTGNPGRIYRLDLNLFSKAGVTADKVTDSAQLKELGVTLFGEVRDRNVRRLALLPDGRVLAGSAPKGNVYSFARDGGSPIILQENRDAEVTDLLVLPSGDVYAALVFAPATGSAARINRPVPVAAPSGDKDAANTPANEPPQERFTGRSTVVWFPAGNGFPETLVSRTGVAFYSLVKRGDQLLIASGEQGDLLGYDLKERRSLTFPGSISAQLNGLATVDDQRVIALRNNAPGLALIDFAGEGPRELETRRLDVGVPARLGALRFNRLRNLPDGLVGVTMRTNFGSDELEGWSNWTPLETSQGAWKGAQTQHGRYLRLKLTLPSTTPSTLEIDKAQLFFLPQNRRPSLTDFRLFGPNFALLPMPPPAPQATTSLGQALNSGKEGSDDKRRNTLLSSPLVPAPGMRIAYWTLNDPDGDDLVSTFSIRKDGDTKWIDLAVDTDTTYAQFDTSHLSDGVYFTRLTVKETAPRATADRLSTTFETDDLVLDRTPPEWVFGSAERKGDQLVITVQGRDQLSLMEGADFRFNNGLVESVSQPLDGIRDSREETFVLEIPLARIAPATSVEVQLYDASGNSVARRLTW